MTVCQDLMEPVAVDEVRDRGLDDGAEAHVTQGKAELQGSERLVGGTMTNVLV